MQASLRYYWPLAGESSGSSRESGSITQDIGMVQMQVRTAARHQRGISSISRHRKGLSTRRAESGREGDDRPHSSGCGIPCSGFQAIRYWEVETYLPEVRYRERRRAAVVTAKCRSLEGEGEIFGISGSGAGKGISAVGDCRGAYIPKQDRFQGPCGRSRTGKPVPATFVYQT